MKQRRCREYAGVACIDGSCPIARMEEYEERGVAIVENCQDCIYYKGCEDCALKGTEYCERGAEDNGKEKEV